MTEEQEEQEQEDENKSMSPREQARGQKYFSTYINTIPETFDFYRPEDR